MRRCPALTLVVTLALSACGTRVPEAERTARRPAPGQAANTRVAENDAAVEGGNGGDGALGPQEPAAANGPARPKPTGGAALPPGRLTGTSASATNDIVAPAPSPGAAETPGQSQGEPGASDPGVTDTEIRIGASGPLSGLAGFIGEEVFGGIDSYFQTINGRGGVGGRKLRLIAYDDRFDSSQTLANVRRLYERDKVVAIFVLFGDPITDYVTRNRIPSLVFGVTPKSFSSKHPTVFPMVGNALLWTQELIAALKSKGVLRQGMRVGMLYDTQILDVSPYVPFLKQSWENAGARVVSTDSFNLSDGDCTSLVLKMRQLQIDYWDFQGLGWVLCASAAARQQYRPPMGWGSWATSAAGLASQVGPWIDGMWSGSQGDQPDGKPRTKTAAHDEYVNAIRTYHPRLNTMGHLESPATIGFWVGAKLLVAAIQAQGAVVTKAGVTDWISKVENFDPGITPPIVSMAPHCKVGSEVVWVGRWRWDPNRREASRVPESGYFSSDQESRFGGKCFLTRISDSFEK